MNTEIEDLLRDGMERFTEEVRAPAGLARAASELRRRHRRRLAVRATAACGGIAVAAAAAVVAVTGGTPAPAGGSAAQSRTVAYVTGRVERALDNQHLVFASRTLTSGNPPITWATWAYGRRGSTKEFTHGGSRIYLATGTARVGGKLRSVYVTYYNREWSLLPPGPSQPAPACSPAAAQEIGGPGIPASDWRAFISASLRCGAATATGHVRINGVETTKITGKPVTIRVPPGGVKYIGGKWLTTRWTLYVNPTTYLPVRMDSWSRSFGGRWPSSTISSVTDVQWLPPTPANIAKAQVIIPAGFHQVSSPANQ